MSGGPTSTPDDDPLGPVMESFLARFRRGERPAVTELIERYPDLAGPIRELLPAMVELEQLALSAGGVAPASGGGDRPGGDAPAAAGPPRRLGDYLILRRIGVGGMGVVYEAEHHALRSRVALKVMHPRYRDDLRYLRRFRAEARLAAGLHHTNIVSVFDYGAQDGVCYYAMPFIVGQPLDRVQADLRRLRDRATGPDDTIGLDPSAGPPPTAASAIAEGLLTGRFPPHAGPAPAAVDRLDPTAEDDEPGATRAHPPAIAGPADLGGPSAAGSTSLVASGELRYFREVARIGAQVADALGYAHRRGVLHRDIKPSNLLLDALGNVWITDFGLAKLEDGEDLTRSRELVGTLRYMAPERLRGASDRRGDLYSLGATLYELLTLRPPFGESDQIRLIEQIREGAPPPPRRLDRNIPRDLETIVLKAMARDPKDRFASADELAGELRRFVEGRPIRSRPVSIPERLWRWCKRERRLAAACLAAAILTVVLVAVSTGAAWVYRDQLVRIRRAETATRRALFDALRDQARGTRFGRRQGQRFDALRAIREAAAIARELRLPPGDLDRLRDEAIACLALPDLEPTGRAFDRPPGAFHVAFDRSLTRYAVRSRDRTITVRDAYDDREIARLAARGDRDAFILEFSPDGRYLASEDVPTRALNVWDIDGDGDRSAPILTDPGPAWWQVSFHRDGRRLLVAGEGLREYDLARRRLVRAWPGRLFRGIYRPDGARIAVVDASTRPPTCRILDAESGRPVGAFALRNGPNYLAWSPDGSTLAMGYDDGRIDLWDVAAGARRASLEGDGDSGQTLSFHPAGTLLASNGWAGRLRLWDPIRGQPLLSMTGGGSRFRGDGRIVLEVEGRLAAYRVEPATEYRAFARGPGGAAGYHHPAIRRDGRILAAATEQGLALWDLAGGAELAFLPIGRVWAPIFEPSGDLLTIGAIGVQRWPIRPGDRPGELRIGPPRRLPLPASACGIAQDRSGRVVAVSDHRFAHVATPDRTLLVGPLDDCRSVAVSPDGRWLATGSHVASGGAQVWRIVDGAKVADLPIEGGNQVAFTPDGRWLVTGNPRPRLWRVNTWRRTMRPRTSASTSPPTAASWSSSSQAGSSAWSSSRPAGPWHASRDPS